MRGPLFATYFETPSLPIRLRWMLLRWMILKPWATSSRPRVPICVRFRYSLLPRWEKACKCIIPMHACRWARGQAHIPARTHARRQAGRQTGMICCIMHLFQAWVQQSGSDFFWEKKPSKNWCDWIKHLSEEWSWFIPFSILFSFCFFSNEEKMWRKSSWEARKHPFFYHSAGKILLWGLVFTIHLERANI